MALLQGLGLLERFIARRKVTAGILHVPVQPHPVEVVAEIVVVGGVPARLSDWVVLRHTAELARQRIPENLGRRHVEAALVDEKDAEQIPCAAILDDQSSVHIGLGWRQLRVQRNFPVEGGVEDTDRRARPVAVSKGLLEPIGSFQRQPPLANRFAQKFGKESHRRLAIWLHAGDRA